MEFPPKTGEGMEIALERCQASLNSLPRVPTHPIKGMTPDEATKLVMHNLTNGITR